MVLLNLQARLILWWQSVPGSCNFGPGCSCPSMASTPHGGPCGCHRPSCTDAPAENKDSTGKCKLS